MNDMEEKRDNKEIRVRLHHIDRGNCTEVWEVQTEKGKPRRYLGRDDGYGPKSGTRSAMLPTAIANATAM